MGIWHTAPFVRIILFFLPGIIIGMNVPGQDTVFRVVLGLSGMLLASTLVIRSRQYISTAWFYALAGVFSLGYLSVDHNPGASLPDGTVRVKGTVIDYPQPTKSGEKFTAGGVIFYVRGNGIDLKPGDDVTIDAELKEPGFPVNPGGFDYGEYLRSKGIFAAAFIDREDVNLTKSGCRSLTCFAKRIRHRLEEVIDRHVHVDVDRALVKALVLGDRAELSGDHRDAFAKAGAMHILAVSGLHVGIVWMIVGRLLGMFNRIRRPPWWKVLVVVTVIWTYALITGLSASVIRASTMFSFIVIGMGLNRKQSIYNSITASAFFLLLFDHRLLFDVGFQLSYCAVIGIVVIYPRLYSKLYFKKNLPDKIWALVCVSIAAQIATLPLVLYYFGRFPTWFLLTNIIVIPVAFIVLTSALALLLVDEVGVGEEIVGTILNLATRALNASVETISRLPYSTVDHLWIREVDLVLFSLFIISLTCWLLYKRKKWIWVTFLCCVGLLVNDVRWELKRADQAILLLPYSKGRSTISVIKAREVIHYIRGEDPIDPYYEEGLIKEYGIRHQRIERISDSVGMVTTLPGYKVIDLRNTP